jgi:hypothetical protein
VVIDFNIEKQKRKRYGPRTSSYLLFSAVRMNVRAVRAGAILWFLPFF